jgi:hypothetical protein
MVVVDTRRPVKRRRADRQRDPLVLTVETEDLSYQTPPDVEAAVARNLELDSLALEPAGSEPVASRRCRLGSVGVSEDRACLDGSALLAHPSWAGYGPDCAVRAVPRRLARVRANPLYVAVSRTADSSQEPSAIPRKAGVEGSNPSVGLAL